jgi:hypothetical protein
MFGKLTAAITLFLRHNIKNSSRIISTSKLEFETITTIKHINPR